MFGCMIGYTVFRGLIGYYRVRDNIADSPEVSLATSCAFLFWGIADIVIFALLVVWTSKQMSSGGWFGATALTILKSSLPRLLILVLNTFVIVILGQITKTTQNHQDISNLAWAIKGTYPIILLFDLMATRELLLMNSTGSNGSKMVSTTPELNQSKI